MAPFKGWLNPAYLLASANASCQRLVNLFAEVFESGDEKAVGYLRGCPGLTLKNTLPTSPLRGLLAGGTPLTPTDGSGGRLFAVAGSKLYELDSTGAPINGIGGKPDRGDVGNDGKPVQMFPSGNQLGIVSAGQFWCDNGAGPMLASYPVIAGGVNTTAGSPNITWYGGDPFQGGPHGDVSAGDAFIINSGAFTVLSVTDSTHLVLTSPVAYGGANQPYVDPALSGIVSVNGTAVTWRSGDQFPLYGLNSIILRGITYAVDHVISPTSLVLATSAGTYIEAYGASPGFGAACGAFLDNFFIVSPPNSKQINVSAPLDGTSWDALDYATKESYPDNIGALLADHQELYVLGESKSEVWAAPGADPSFPFQPNESAAMSVGIAAPATARSVVDGICWLGADLRGQPVAYYARGFQPTRISTHAIEQVWKGFSTVADAAAFTYEMDGHIFWQINFPTGDQTWVYDFTASAQMGKPMWHERNSWDGAAFHRHRACCHAFVFNKHWVGDFANGNVYEMSPAVYQDNGQTITCIRTLPHLCAERLRQFFGKLQLDLETGGGQALTIVLEWSDDGGNTWVGGGTNFTYVTSTTKKLDRAVFWQLGSADDRVFRVTVTGNARKALINAYLDVVQGIS